MTEHTENGFFRFQERFRTEGQCFEYLRGLRWPNGFECPKCGHHEAYFHRKRKLFQCKACHPPILFSIAPMCRSESGFGLFILWERTSRDFPRSDWNIIRSAMAERDIRYMLDQWIEMDEAFFGGPSSGKRGRGATNTSKVIIAVENRGVSVGYAKMAVVESLDGTTIQTVAQTTIRNQSIIHADDYSAYSILASHFQHRGETVKAHDAKEKLP